MSSPPEGPHAPQSAAPATHQPPDRLLAARPRLFLAAGALAILSLGLPWQVAIVRNGPADATLTNAGTQHPVRVLALLGGLLVWWGMTRGPHRIAWGGLGLAGLALVMGAPGSAVPPGRLVYAVAVALAAIAVSAGAAQRSGEPHDGTPPT